MPVEPLAELKTYGEWLTAVDQPITAEEVHARNAHAPLPDASPLTSRRPPRRIMRLLSVAAVLGVFATAVALVGRQGDGSIAPQAPPTGPSVTASVPTSPSQQPTAPTVASTSVGSGADIAQVAGLVAPGLAPTAAMAGLGALPVCADAGDLAEWASRALAFAVPVDPAAATPASFSDVAAQIPVDTAATGVACTASIAIGDAMAWALIGDDGAVIARGAGQLVPGYFPAGDGDRQLGTNGSWTLGTGQLFSSYPGRTDEAADLTTGLISSGPVLAIQAAAAADGADAWLSLQTWTPANDYTAVQPQPAALQPALLPAGYGRCGGWGMPVHYCRGDDVIIAGADPVDTDGASPRTIAGRAVLVSETHDRRTITSRDGVGVTISGPLDVPLEELATAYASIPITDPAWASARAGGSDLRAWWTTDGIDWAASELTAAGYHVTQAPNWPSLLVDDGTSTASISVALANLDLAMPVAGTAVPFPNLISGMTGIPALVDLGDVDAAIAPQQAATQCGGLVINTTSSAPNTSLHEQILRTLVTDLKC